MADPVGRAALEEEADRVVEAVSLFPTAMDEREVGMTEEEEAMVLETTAEEEKVEDETMEDDQTLVELEVGVLEVVGATQVEVGVVEVCSGGWIWV